MKYMMAGHRYPKGDFHAHCSLEDCKGVADHCIKYALSYPTEKLYQSNCNYSSHENSFDQCEIGTISEVYELSGCGFESHCSHLNFRYRACF